MNKKRFRNLYLILIALVAIGVVVYLGSFLFTYRAYIKVIWNGERRGELPSLIGEILKERNIKIVGILIASILTASASLVFQTTTNNRILTPGALGFDSIYGLIQTLIVMIFGIGTVLVNNKIINFVVATLIMLLVVFLIFSLVMRINSNNIALLLLVGMITSSLAGSMANFFRQLLNPEEFAVVIGVSSVTLVNVNVPLVLISLPIGAIIIILMYLKSKELDVLSLGKDEARSLGVNVTRSNRVNLVLVSIATALATALVGPLSFLGLLAVNLARELGKTHKHKHVFIISSMIAFIFLVLGQSIVEMSGFITTATVLINLVGGTYMIYLIVRRKA